MKKLLITIGNALGFFVLWAILASMDFLYEPQFIHENPAVTRLWWKLVPLIVTVIVTLMFEKVIEKGRVHIQLIGQPFRDFILGVKNRGTFHLSFLLTKTMIGYYLMV